MIKSKSPLGLVLLFLIPGLYVPAQESNFRQQLESINAELATAFRNKDAKTVMKYYDDQSVCMPEYHITLFNTTDIKRYFQQWLSVVKSSTYQRTIHEVLSFPGYLIETGTFTDTVIKTSNDTFTYAGKYMRHWKIQDNKKLVIYSDIWGGSSFTERSKFPLTGSEEPVKISPYNTGTNIEKEVKQRNRLIAELVTQRKGGEHAMLFTNDAIYMTYYTPMLIGMENIRAYFVDHEKPGDVTIDSIRINTGRTTGMGDFVLEHGYYGVRWSAGGNTGVVTGKSLNLWKRNEKGVLMMYRQMVNHN